MKRKNKVVKELKRRLTEEHDFKVAADYFFDVVAQLPQMQVSDTVQNECVQQAVAMAVRQALKKPVQPERIVVGRLAGTRMLHGMAPVDSALCVFFYFEGDDLGLAIVSPFGHREATALIRLSVFSMPPDVGAVPGPRVKS